MRGACCKMGHKGAQGAPGGASSSPAGMAPLFLSVFLLYGVNNAETSALPSCLLSLGGSPFLAGLQNSLFVLAAIALRLPFGRLADRLGAKPLLLVGAAGFLLPCLPMALCTSVGALFALRIVQAVGLAAFHPFVAQYISAHSSSADAPGRIGFSRFAATLSLMVVPTVLFPLIGPDGFEGFFGALGAMAAAGLALILPLEGGTPSPQGMGPTGQKPTESAESGAGAKSAARLLRIPRGAALVVALPFFFSLPYSIILVFGPQHMAQMHPDLNSGLILSFVSAGGLAGSLLASRLSGRLGARRAVSLIAAIFAFGMAALPLSGPIAPVMFAGAAACGFGYCGAIASLVAELGGRGGEHMGSLFAAQQTCLDFGIVLGSFLAGSLLGLGIPLAAAFSAGALLLVACAFLWFARYTDCSSAASAR